MINEASTYCACGHFGTGWYSMVRFRINKYVTSACFSPGRGKLCLECARKDGQQKADSKNAAERRA